MALLAVILILIVWGIIKLKEAATPRNPPIDNIQEHCRIIQSLPNQKTRQKYLMDLAKRK